MKKSTSIKTIWTLVFVLIATSLFAQWQPTNGLYSGEAYSVIVSNNEIIVGTKQIYKSADNGKTWFISNNGMSGSVSAIRTLVKINSNLVAGTDAGVFYSSDNGNNWTQSAGTASLNIWCMIVKGSNVFISTLGSGIYKSTNNGVSWVAVNTGITTPLVDMRAIVAKGTDLYAGSDGRGIYKSTNDGASWTTVNTGLPGSFYSVVGLAVVGNNILAGTGGAGVYKSTNNGANWSAVNNGVSSTDYIMGMGVNGNSIYASTLTGNLYKTTDYINWNAVAVGPYTSTRYEGFYSLNNDFYIASWGYGSPEKSYGIFKTSNDGDTWKHIGIIDMPVSVIEVSGNNIIAGTDDITGNTSRISLFKTTETDSVWTYNLGGFAGSNITALKANGAIMYIFDYQGGGNSQVYRSTNNGNNWTSTGYDAIYFKIDKFVIAGSLVYAANNSSSSGLGVIVSSNNGQTWTGVNSGINSSITAIYDLILKGNTLFLATNNGIYKNTVGQNNWTAVNSGLTNMYIKSLGLLGNDLYAGTQGGGIFKSSNDGALWTLVDVGLPLFANISCFATSGTNIFAGTDNGVFQSTNNGSSWNSINMGLIDSSITALKFSANYFWAGTSSQGIWRRESSQLVGSVPATPGSISGSATVCQGSTNNYSVNPVSGATSYTWSLPNGWTGASTTQSIQAVVNSSGTISVTANNSFGSSAPQTLNVNVTTINVGVVQTGLTLTANASGASYQWIDCNGNVPISNQINQSFTATTAGNYAVIVSQNGCSDTSLCYFADTLCHVNITGADLPFSGLSVLLHVDTLTSVSLGNPAASQNWNYSMLLQHYPKVADYKLTSTTPYASEFSGSNIYTYGPGIMFGSLYGTAPVGTGNNGYVFWKSDNTGLWVEGFRPDGGQFAGTNVHVNGHELLIGAPASMGDVFQNSSRWVLPMDKNPADIDTIYVKVSTKTITADACGSITTPYSTYSSVLRQHEYVITIDSVYAKMGSNIVSALEFSRDTLNNYLYIANGIGYPVCIVHTDKHNNIKDVEYYSGIYSGIHDANMSGQLFNVYPNPSNGKLTVEVYKENVTNQSRVFLYNSVGSLIFEKTDNESLIQIDVENYPKGIYFLKVLSGNRVNTQKIIIQ